MKKILSFLFVSMIFLQTSYADENKCVDQFGSNLREMPCDCFYKSQKWFSQSYLTTVDNALESIRKKSVAQKISTYEKLNAIISDKISWINRWVISITPSNKAKFFAVWGYLTCKISNEYARDNTVFYNSNNNPFQKKLKENLQSNTIPNDFEKLSSSSLNIDINIFTVYRGNSDVYISDFIIHDLESGQKIYLDQNVYISNLKKWLNWIYFTEFWPNW